MNRIGDFGLMVALIGIYYMFGSFEFSVVFANLPFVYFEKFLFFNTFFISKITFICVFLFLGVMGKSAQFGLHTWLPTAMEGPTPVSALIHAATMVTAGIFLILRCSFIFELSSNSLSLIMLFGSITCLLFAIVGAFQQDIKRIIAYSTCSQLGYMIFACGISQYYVGIFHLFNHAFFKALLFLSAGAIIHILCDEQDIRKMGGLYACLPFIFSCVLIGSLSLIGIPFLTGYYSKDMLLEFAFSRYMAMSDFSRLCGLWAVIFTSYYSIKLLHWVFLARPNSYKIVMYKLHSPDWFVYFPLFFLSVCSICVGFLFSHLSLGVGFIF